MFVCFFFGGVSCVCWWFFFGLALLLCGVALGAWWCCRVLRGGGLPVAFGLFGAGVAGAGLWFCVVVFGFGFAFSFFACGCALVGCFGVVAAGAVCRRALGLLRRAVVCVAVSVGAFCGVAGWSVPVGLGGSACGSFVALACWARLSLLLLLPAGFGLRVFFCAFKGANEIFFAKNNLKAKRNLRSDVNFLAKSNPKAAEIFCRRANENPMRFDDRGKKTSFPPP